LREIVARLAMRYAWPGALNGLARTILKLTLPGVPDFYQGTEFWDFAFVDPDNRRPVDFRMRAQNIETWREQSPGALLSTWRDGRIKQWLAARLLAERVADPDLFAFGDYAPAACAAGVAYHRRYQERALYVCAATGTQLMSRGLLETPASVWTSEKLTLARGQWRNLLTGSAFAVEGAVTCAEVAGGLPWLILGKMA
jgi:(1->4)-alpha-D-glucan 1-alpha-D-glucosylmutase